MSADSFSTVLLDDFFAQDKIAMDRNAFLFLNLLGVVVSFLGIVQCARALNIPDTDNTPQLNTGPTTAELEIIRIDANNYSTALSLPRFFADGEDIMRFTDGDNEITIYPHKQEVTAIFLSGEKLTYGIPPNYQMYSLKFENTAKILAEDIENILQWQDATTLYVSDNCDLAYDLSQRIDQMKEMRYLEQLGLSIQRKSYSNLRIESILINLPALEYVNLNASRLTDAEFDEFVEQQLIVAGWQQSTHDKTVYYEKIHIDYSPPLSEYIKRIAANIRMKIRNRYDALARRFGLDY